MSRTPAIFTLLLTLAVSGPVVAQRWTLDDAVTRLGEFIAGYESRLASIVAEETYVQTLTTPRTLQVRTLRSEYALAHAADRGIWVGYRDTFEVDGVGVRDRDSRLQRLIASGALAQAARIASENSRYNLASDVVTRNVNVPTFALEILHPRNRSRWTFRRGESRGAVSTDVDIEFRERERPTMVRRPDGRDNPMRGSIRLRRSTGEVARTRVSWEAVPGSVDVTYGKVEGIDVVVPLTMTERFTRGNATITAEATYSNYRQFRTGGRVITP